MESGTIREKKGRHLQLHTKLLESREIRQTVGHAGPPDYKDVPMQRRPSFLMADTSRRVELDRDQNGVVGSLKIARIRVLLAPKMDPYVIPMHKVQSWESLLEMLKKLFGDQIACQHLRITDCQGNKIVTGVWEDLLEPGMTIVVDTRPFSEGHSPLNVKCASEDVSSESRIGIEGPITIVPMKQETVGKWAYAPQAVQAPSIAPPQRLVAPAPPPIAQPLPPPPPPPPQLPPLQPPPASLSLARNDYKEPERPKSRGGRVARLASKSTANLRQFTSFDNLGKSAPGPELPKLEKSTIQAPQFQRPTSHAFNNTPRTPPTPPSASPTRFTAMLAANLNPPPRSRSKSITTRFTSSISSFLAKRNAKPLTPPPESSLLSRLPPVENNPDVVYNSSPPSLSTRRGRPSPPTIRVPPPPKIGKVMTTRRSKSTGNLKVPPPQRGAFYGHQKSPSLPPMPSLPAFHSAENNLGLNLNMGMKEAKVLNVRTVAIASARGRALESKPPASRPGTSHGKREPSATRPVPKEVIPDEMPDSGIGGSGTESGGSRTTLSGESSTSTQTTPPTTPPRFPPRTSSRERTSAHGWQHKSKGSIESTISIQPKSSEDVTNETGTSMSSSTSSSRSSSTNSQYSAVKKEKKLPKPPFAFSAFPPPEQSRRERVRRETVKERQMGLLGGGGGKVVAVGV